MKKITKTKNGLNFRKHLLIALLSVVLLIIILISLTIGRYKVDMKELTGVLFSFIYKGERFWEEISETIVLGVRLPRVLIAVMVGGALSVSGASFQSIFRNPMAAPNILGASTGAAFGAALAILNSLGKIQITLYAFAFSMICIAIVMLVSKLSRTGELLSLILSGIMISSLFQAGVSYLKLVADPTETLPEITYWLMGSLNGRNLNDLSYIWIPMLIGIVPIFLLRWKMNLLTMNDDEARTMGVNTKRTRVVLIISTTLLTAASVSVSGIIGWVGLVIPHMARRLIGNDCRFLIPCSAVMGGIFLLLVDNLARNLYTTELPLGILTSIIGVPFFVYLLIRKDK